MLTPRTSCGWLLLVVPFFIVGCGGPSQSAMDNASRTTDGVASSNRLSEIQIPDVAVGETAPGQIDNYDVQIAPQPSQRPVSVSDLANAKVPAAAANTVAAKMPTAAPATPAAKLTPPANTPPGNAPPAAANLSSGLKAPANAGPLTIGDRAPELEIADWLKGTEVDGFQASKVYVVEFWATWCGPCKMNMPHLSQLQQELGEQVQFIGISDEPAAKITGFFKTEAAPGKTWDDVLQYTIAADRDKSTKVRYMQAAGERGIPCAFVVGRDGRIQWIGHPARIDQPLAEILAGDWDLDAARIARDNARRYEQAFMALRTRMGGWISSKDYASAIGALDAMAVEFPDRNEPLMMKLEVLREAEMFPETYPVISELMQRHWTDPNMLSQLAWLIAAETKGADRDLELALKAAKRSVELTSEKAPIALDTLARVYFEQQDLENAVAWQTKATELPGKFQEEMLETLQRYKDASE